MKSFYVVIIVTVFFTLSISTKAQINIDWQQCLGGAKNDIPHDMKLLVE